MGDWREQWLDLSIASGVALIVVTESLGALSWLSTWVVRAVWLGWLVVLVAGVLRRRMRTSSNVQQSGLGLALSSRIVLAGVICIVILVGISAFYAPPNAIDSLNYHMSRVVNWQQRQSIDAYPTGYLPQLYQPPWAEFAILSLQIAIGSDRLAGGVQWVSMLGSLILVSSIARYLGASTKGQVLAAAFAGALPTGILEGSGALNDWDATLWMAAFVVCVLRIWRQPARRGWVGYAFAGAALGLALATKGTNYIYAVGFILLLSGVSFRSGFTRFLPHLTLVGALVVALNSAYFVRNYQLFGSVLGPAVDEVNGSSYFVGSITWNGFLSNVARNLELEIATPDPILNRELFNHIEQFHDWIGIATNSPLTTWNESSFKPAQFSFHEAQAGNLLAVIALLTMLVYRHGRWPTRPSTAAERVCVRLGRGSGALLPAPQVAAVERAPAPHLAGSGGACCGQRLDAAHRAIRLATHRHGLRWAGYPHDRRARGVEHHSGRCSCRSTRGHRCRQPTGLTATATDEAARDDWCASLGLRQPMDARVRIRGARPCVARSWAAVGAVERNAPHPG